jgi:hypothetical protein
MSWIISVERLQDEAHLHEGAVLGPLGVEGLADRVADDTVFFLVPREEDDVLDVGDGVDDAPGELGLGLAVDRPQLGDAPPEAHRHAHVDRQPAGQDGGEGRRGPKKQHQQEAALHRQRHVVPVGAFEQRDRLLREQHRPVRDLPGQHVVEVGRAVSLRVGED